VYDESPCALLCGGGLLAGSGAVVTQLWWISLVVVAVGLAVVAASRLISRPKIDREAET
jgi:hypothetical protein